MPDLLEQPSQPAVNPRYAGLRPFNSQTAREAAYKRFRLERERLERAEQAARMQAKPDQPSTQDLRIALIDEQIALARATLNDTKLDWCPACERGGLNIKDRAALLRALCGLLEQQRIARGEPLPGSRRPREERSRTAPAYDDSPPVPAKPACGVHTPTSSVPPQARMYPTPQDTPKP